MNSIEPKKLSILAVDDNQMNLILMKSMFKTSDYDVYYADCGKKAIEMARQNHPDMILLDIVMPDLSGFEVCRILKEEEDFKEVPVIFITAADDLDFMLKGFEAGGVDFLTKPFRKEEILIRIKTHLDLKQTRAQLLETKNSLYESNKVKNRLFSFLGYDLRSPIENVKIVLELMSKGILDPNKGDQYKEIISDLLNTTNEVSSLLENLLLWATHENGNLKSNPENINLKEAVISILNLFQAGIRSKNITLNINIDNNHIVFANLNMIKTVISNLFSNAVKFTPSAGTISFDSYLENDIVKICVSDTGIGISNDVIDEILNPTINISNDGSNKESNIAQRLKICRKYIEKSNGKLMIESKLGSGTNVLFTLPAKNEEMVTEDAKTLVW